MGEKSKENVTTNKYMLKRNLERMKDTTTAEKAPKAEQRGIFTPVAEKKEAIRKRTKRRTKTEKVRNKETNKEEKDGRRRRRKKKE